MVLFPGGRQKESPETAKFQDFFWQRVKDSNPHIQSQSLLCYLYTNPLSLLFTAANRYYYTRNALFVNRFFQFFYFFLRHRSGTLLKVRKCYENQRNRGHFPDIFPVERHPARAANARAGETHYVLFIARWPPSAGWTRASCAAMVDGSTLPASTGCSAP